MYVTEKKTRERKMKKLNKKNIAAAVLFAGGTYLFFTFCWLANKYDKVSLDQILYQIKTTASGTGSDVISSAFLEIGLYGTLSAAAGFVLWWLLYMIWRAEVT